ncbi:hypothetical protein [Frigidibacter sp. ROC022]|uniref:hypothetical protein n=1 Tax=Frigidibacter sp. ROC022 TaxID=2971796 RepID=UPI00215B451E|nr:hypothetical protein [Frigidibacter sp. ROC022]MCR8726388.1 hypothetical protein [Frigidibacter sp. ROC022]
MTQGTIIGLDASAKDRPAAMRRVVLVICEADENEDGGTVGQIGPGFVHAGFQQLGAELLDSVKPDMILSPLICRSFDCVDVAQILAGLGYRGTYRAVTRSLPAPGVIRREVAKLCPGLSFDLTFIDV